MRCQVCEASDDVPLFRERNLGRIFCGKVCQQKHVASIDSSIYMGLLRQNNDRKAVWHMILKNAQQPGTLYGKPIYNFRGTVADFSDMRGLNTLVERDVQKESIRNMFRFLFTPEGNAHVKTETQGTFNGQSLFQDIFKEACKFNDIIGLVNLMTEDEFVEHLDLPVFEKAFNIAIQYGYDWVLDIILQRRGQHQLFIYGVNITNLAGDDHRHILKLLLSRSNVLSDKDMFDLFQATVKELNIYGTRLFLSYEPFVKNAKFGSIVNTSLKDLQWKVQYFTEKVEIDNMLMLLLSDDNVRAYAESSTLNKIREHTKNQKIIEMIDLMI